MFGVKRKPKPTMRHRIRVEVIDEPNVLRRTMLLHGALIRVLTGTRLVRLIDADYEAGCIDVLIEGARINPDPAPGKVRVEFLRTPQMKGRS